EHQHGVGKIADRIGDLAVPTRVVKPVLVVFLEKIVPASPHDKERALDVCRRNEVHYLAERVIGLGTTVRQIVVRIVGKSEARGEILHPQRPVRPSTIVVKIRFRRLASGVREAVAEGIERVVRKRLWHPVYEAQENRYVK